MTSRTDNEKAIVLAMQDSLGVNMRKVFIADEHDTCRLALKLTVLFVKK